jgi:outer membrane protein TolC
MQPGKTLILALACAFAAAGCGTIRNARAAQDAALAVPGERTPSARELGLPLSGKIDLATLERAALRAHPSIAKARRNLDLAAARVGEAEAAYWPEFSTGSIASYRYQDQKKPGPGVDVEHHFRSFGFSVSWLLFDFGRTPALVRESARRELAAQADLRSAIVEAIFGVRQAFFNLRKQRELLAVAGETVRQFEARLEQVKGFVKVGTRVPYDETKAELDLGNARLARQLAVDAERAAQAALANAIGLAEVTDWEPLAHGPPSAFPMTFDEAWAYARDHEPRIASARALEEAASAVVDAQIAALFPSIDLSFGYSASGTSFPLRWSWSAGPTLSWLIFNGFANGYAIDGAAASLRAARAARAATEQQVWLDVRTSYVALEDARARLDLSALNVRSAEENLALAQGRFEVGRASSVDLTDAQVALAQARSDEVQARADYDTAIARLERALGIAEGTPGGAP